MPGDCLPLSPIFSPPWLPSYSVGRLWRGRQGFGALIDSVGRRLALVEDQAFFYPQFGVCGACVAAVDDSFARPGEPWRVLARSQIGLGLVTVDRLVHYFERVKASRTPHRVVFMLVEVIGPVANAIKKVKRCRTLSCCRPPRSEPTGRSRGPSRSPHAELPRQRPRALGTPWLHSSRKYLLQSCSDFCKLSPRLVMDR